MTTNADMNTTICECCGQPRPYPTTPGYWEYCPHPASKDTWYLVGIIEDEEGLLCIPHGATEPIWWPNNCTWRPYQRPTAKEETEGNWWSRFKRICHAKIKAMTS